MGIFSELTPARFEPSTFRSTIGHLIYWATGPVDVPYKCFFHTTKQQEVLILTSTNQMVTLLNNFVIRNFSIGLFSIGCFLQTAVMWWVFLINDYLLPCIRWSHQQKERTTAKSAKSLKWFAAGLRKRTSFPDPIFLLRKNRLRETEKGTLGRRKRKHLCDTEPVQIKVCRDGKSSLSSQSQVGQVVVYPSPCFGFT